jgi:nucleotide-binding universal stress UspA family protein
MSHPKSPEDATVVVGYDGSASARVAAASAARLAAGGHVVLVHAHEPTPPHASSRWQELLQQDAQSRSRAVVEELAPEVRRALEGTTVQALAEDGPPADALLRVADRTGAIAIVVGSHGYGPSGSLLGSVSAALVERAEVPVVVIPPGCRVALGG